MASAEIKTTRDAPENAVVENIAPEIVTVKNRNSYIAWFAEVIQTVRIYALKPLPEAVRKEK